MQDIWQRWVFEWLWVVSFLLAKTTLLPNESLIQWAYLHMTATVPSSVKTSTTTIIKHCTVDQLPDNFYPHHHHKSLPSAAHAISATALENFHISRVDTLPTDSPWEHLMISQDYRWHHFQNFDSAVGQLSQSTLALNSTFIITVPTRW